MEDNRKTPAISPRFPRRILVTALSLAAIPILALLFALAVTALPGLPAAQDAPVGKGPPPKDATPAVKPPAVSDQDLVRIQGIRLRKVGDQLNLHFLLSGPAPHRMVANLTKRVLVIKFANALAAFPDDKHDFVFNVPYLEGVSFEKINDRETWAKIKLRSPHLVFLPVADPRANRVVVGLKPAPAGKSIVLTSIRLARRQQGSRLVLEMTDRPEIEGEQDGRLYQIRLKGVVPRLLTPSQLKDRNVAVLDVKLDGRDTLVRVRTLKAGLQPQSRILPGPSRLVIDFQPGSAQIGKTPIGPLLPNTLIRPPTGDTPERVLLDFWGKKNPLLEANYRQALLEHEDRNYRLAYRLFLQVHDAIPDHELGVLALFRASDAQYQTLVGIDSRNFHSAIANYQAAIRSSLKQKRPHSEFVAKGLFQIARSYQRMGFNFESNVHFEILQKDFPGNTPYTQNSYYHQGINFIALNKPKDAVAALMTFLDNTSAPELEGPARYTLGDAQFSLKKYPQAMAQFDLAKKLDTEFPKTRPLLLFHMGETYYENADFEEARVLYRQLLDSFPDKDYTKLVGLRLGDFLREEGKENEAIAIYRQVIRNAPKEILLRGKLRIANLLGKRPEGRQLGAALQLYDEVIAEGQGDLVMQEALLRKGLTETLHGRHLPAIATFERLAKEFPKGPYTRDNLIRSNIEENLKALINTLYANNKYYEVLKLYSKYKDRYFRDFRFPFSLMLVGRSYHQLGLYDEAIGLYDEVLKGGKSGPLAPLLTVQKAWSYLEKDDLSGAETTLTLFVQEVEKDTYRIDAQKLLGKVYITGRRYQDALRSFRRIVADFKGSRDPSVGESISEVQFNLGRIYKELGRNKEALESFRSATEAFHHPIQGANVPDFVPMSHFLAADMLFDLNQNQEAIEAYQKAVRLYPKHNRTPWAGYQIGLIYRRTGEDKKALEEFNRLMELAKVKPGEIWVPLARENQRDLSNKLGYQNYLKR